MTSSEIEADLRIAKLLDEAQSQLRARQTIDVAAYQLRYPDLANELPALLETQRNLATAAENWKSCATLDKFEPRIGAESPARILTKPGKPLPSHFGRYLVRAKLGGGGMGTVYLAFDPNLKREVAVKAPKLDNAIDVKRFLHEASAAAKVSHSHICPIYDSGEQDGIPYVVMKYIEGASLAEFLKHERMAPVRAVELVVKVALGLGAVHEKGIIHRDMKPGNILLDKAGEPLLTDFGLARPENHAERTQLTQEGAVVGTPAYMAPEQASGETKRLGPWTDVYSLSVVLYQLLTGRLPFEGPVLSILHKIAHEPFPPPCSLAPDLDAALEAIVVKGMARRPEDRYQSAREFAAVLNAWLTCPKTPAANQLAATETVEHLAAALPPPRVVPKRRRRLALVTAVVAPLLLLAYFLAPAVNRNVADKGGLVVDGDPPKGGDDQQPPSGLVDGGGQPKDGEDQEPPSEIASMTGHSGSPKFMFFLPKTKLILSAENTAIYFFDTEKRKEIHHTNKVPGLDRAGLFNALALSPDGKTAVSCFAGACAGETSTWDPGTGRQTGYPVPNKAGTRHVAFSSTGRYVAAASFDGVFRVYEFKNGKLYREFKHGTSNHGAVFTPDEKHLITISDEDTIRTWNLELDRQEKGYEGGTARVIALGISPDGKRLFSVGNGGVTPTPAETLLVWDTATKKQVHAIKIEATCFTFAADGQQLLTGHANGTLALWNLVSGEKLFDFGKHKGIVTAVALAPDGRTAVSGGHDLLVRYWRLPAPPVEKLPNIIEKK